MRRVMQKRYLVLFPSLWGNYCFLIDLLEDMNRRDAVQNPKSHRQNRCPDTFMFWLQRPFNLRMYSFIYRALIEGRSEQALWCHQGSCNEKRDKSLLSWTVHCGGAGGQTVSKETTPCRLVTNAVRFMWQLDETIFFTLWEDFLKV